MLHDPGNLDVAFAYADVSARLGDYEGAVSTLERMLLFNPDLPRVQLELGTMYFRMGSYDIARSYFEKAAAANPPPEVRARIDQYLADIEKGESRHHLVWILLLRRPVSDRCQCRRLVGDPLADAAPVVLGNQFTRQASGSIFGSGSAVYSYDLQTQSHDTFDVTGAGYLNHYFNSLVNRLDLALLEVTAGPRFNFPNGGLIGDKPASFRPYGIFDEVGLGWDQYFVAGGFGLEYDQAVWNDLALKGVFEFRQKSFTNAPTRPLSTGLSGSDKLVSLQATKPITENSALNLEFDYLDQSTQLDFYTNMSYAVPGSYRIRYDDPLGITQYPWESSAFLGRLWSNYAAPDPCCVTGPTLGRLPDRLQQPIDAALAIWRDPDLAGAGQHRDRGAAGARHHLVELAALRLQQYFGLDRPADSLLVSLRKAAPTLTLAGCRGTARERALRRVR